MLPFIKRQAGDSPAVPQLLRAAGLGCPDSPRRRRDRVPHVSQGTSHSGQHRPGTALRTWPGSEQRGAAAACGRLWKGRWGSRALPNSESSSAVSGSAGMNPMARTHGKSWTLENIAGNLIYLPVMGMRFNYLFPSRSIY